MTAQIAVNILGFLALPLQYILLLALDIYVYSFMFYFFLGN